VEGPEGSDLTKLAVKLARKVVSWMPQPGETEEQARKRRLAEMRKEEEAIMRAREAERKKLAQRKPGTCPEGMILIPAGEFIMGSAPDDPDRLSNEPKAKKVYVAEFCIDKYEFPNKEGAIPFRKAQWFAGKEECEAQGKRLCTEAEWEKACKGTKGFRYPYGNEFDPKKCNTGTLEAGGKLREGRIAKSGAYKECKSDYGVYDMSGNMWEWVADEYDPGTRTYVLRGGSFASNPKASRCSARRGGIPFLGRQDNGFRCCK